MNPVDAFRRLTRLSAKKKLAAAGFAGLLGGVVLAAYARNFWLLGALVIILLAALLFGALHADRLLKAARRQARSATIARDVALAPRPGASRAQTRPGALAWWGTRSKIPNGRLVQRLVKLRSVEGRDVLVSSLTGGKWSWRDMAAGLEMYRLGGKARQNVQGVLDSSSRTALLKLADLCFRQDILKDDILNAATLYRFVYQKLGAAPFRTSRRGEFFLDALSRTGQGNDVFRLLDLYASEEANSNDLHLYRANAANPFKDPTADADRWLTEINDMYGRAGLARLVLEPGTAPAFLRLTAESTATVTDGPLVSIVMPVYKPDEYTDLAIRSAVNQSYRNVEIIIVDDGSGGDAAERLNRWAQLDSRITVVLNEQNSGAYTSRNIGYSMATGEYLTIFDGDDWQHPQKIELLVRTAAAQTDKRLVAAPWTRADEDLFFHYRGWKGAFITPAHVSTMFHLATIREHLGHWDSVRKAADTEFILRYQTLVHPADPLEATDAPLTLSLVSSTNLSIDDFRLGYRSPDRVSYRDSYEHWHKQIHAGGHSGYLDFPLVQRTFPAPMRFLPSAQPVPELDLLLVGDFGDETQKSHLMFQHLKAATEEGQRIGLLHVPSILHTRSIDRNFPKWLMKAFAGGELLRVEVTDRVKSRTVHVYDPTAFQFARELRSGHAAETVVVWAAEPPFNRTTNEHKYEVGTVERHLSAVFGGRPLWVPLNGSTTRGISNSGHGRLAAIDAGPAVASAEASVPDERPVEAMQVLAYDTVGSTEIGGKQ